jgi:hypothetical protein
MTQGGPLQSTVSVLYLMYEKASAGGTSASPRRSRSCCSADAGVTALLWLARAQGLMNGRAATCSSTARCSARRVLSLAPLLWMLSVSFMQPGEPAILRRRCCRRAHARQLPRAVRSARHGPLLAQQPGDRLAITLLSLLFNTLAGYAFAKLRFAGRDRCSSAARARW